MSNAMSNACLPALIAAFICPFSVPAFDQDASPPPAVAAPADADAAALVRTALDRIGGDAWNRIKSFESTATARSAVGDARIEFRFVAPDARRLVQSMPGGRGVIEMGVVGGKAWMGEPGRARAIDPKIAEEMAGGGDLQTLVHSLAARFEQFAAKGKTSIGGREAWRIEMKPRANALSGMPATAWTVYIDTMNATILGLDIPAPPADAAANAPSPGGQAIRFSEWREVERAKLQPSDAKPPRLLCFGKAEIESGGMKVVLEFDRVAVDTLEPGAITAPAVIEPDQPQR